MKGTAAMFGAGALAAMLMGVCYSSACDAQARAGASAGRFAASAIPVDDESGMDENQDADEDEMDPYEGEYGFEREHANATLVEALGIEADVA